MALGVQAFLGIQLQCAQCHDHPFAQWKQRDFYELAAFTHGIKTEVDLRKKGMLRILLDMSENADSVRFKAIDSIAPNGGKSVGCCARAGKFW